VLAPARSSFFDNSKKRFAASVLALAGWPWRAGLEVIATIVDGVLHYCAPA
jgi:hypothetical protein